jgi:hypothetical protein
MGAWNSKKILVIVGFIYVPDASIYGMNGAFKTKYLFVL